VSRAFKYCSSHPPRSQNQGKRGEEEKETTGSLVRQAEGFFFSQTEKNKGGDVGVD
jgi:hypothetical protein